MKSVNDIMPMIGARFYTQLDAAQVKCDVLEGELAKVLLYEHTKLLENYSAVFGWSMYTPYVFGNHRKSFTVYQLLS